MKIKDIQIHKQVYYVVKIVYLNPNNGYDEEYYLNDDGKMTCDILNAARFKDDHQAAVFAHKECAELIEDTDYDVYLQKIELNY